MEQLKLPPCSLRIRETAGVRQVFDPIRRKWVALTPEEWVRQHFASYLTDHLGYPSSLIKTEAAFRLNSMTRRADIIACDRSGNPALIVECKAPGVKITQAVFDQVINYNFNYGVRFLVVTNGLTHFSGKIDTEAKSFSLLDHIPDYKSLVSE